MKNFAVVLMTVLFLSAFSIAGAADLVPGISLGVSEGYNDNLFLTDTNREGSFVTFVSPGASLAFRSAGSEMKIAYSPTLLFYQAHSNLNTTSHNATLDGSFDVSEQLTLTIDDRFVKSKEINSLIAVPNLGPIISAQELLMNTVTGGVSYKIEKNLTWTVGGSYIYSALTGSAAGTGNTNSNIYSGTSGLAYELNQRSTISVNVQYEANYFSTGNNSRVQYYTLGLTHKLTPTLTLALTGGAAITESGEGGFQTTDFTGSTALTKKFEENTVVLSVAQTISPGIEFGQPLRTQTAALSLSRPLWERWTAGVLGSYTIYKSEPAGPGDNILPVKGEEMRFGADLQYKIRPWASAGLSYNFIDHRNKGAGNPGGLNNYYNNVALLTFTLALERPRAEEQEPISQ